MNISVHVNALRPSLKPCSFALKIFWRGYCEAVPRAFAAACQPRLMPNLKFLTDGDISFYNTIGTSHIPHRAWNRRKLGTH